MCFIINCHATLVMRLKLWFPLTIRGIYMGITFLKFYEPIFYVYLQVPLYILKQNFIYPIKDAYSKFNFIPIYYN